MYLSAATGRRPPSDFSLHRFGEHLAELSAFPNNVWLRAADSGGTTVENSVYPSRLSGSTDVTIRAVG
jgi:hypothetical protein